MLSADPCHAERVDGMNRRNFARTLAGAALGAAALPSMPALAAGEGDVPFKLSVMLWTVYKPLPFDQRLEKMAEAGYHAVELVNEFKDWSDDDFRKANAKKRSLGIVFDSTAGVGKGIADPSGRDAFLTDLKNFFPVAAKLECSTIIVLSGNRVEGVSHEAHHMACIEALKPAADMAAKENVTLLQKNIDQVGLVHIADVPGRHQPGTGEINYASIFRKLAELKYDRYAAMEFMPVGDPVATLRTAREQVAQAVAAPVIPQP